MSVSFLNPLLWLGVLAVAAPLWLHLRRKPEKNVLRFSAVRFLDDAPLPRRSPLRLRDLLLLLLRMLAVLLIVAAFVWPYDPAVDASVVKESRVYILDNTLSHQAENGFMRDRDRIIAEVEGLGRETQTAVIELTGQPRNIVSFGDAPAAAKLKLQELRPSFQRGPYLPAFRQADALLANSLGDRKRIIFLGDHQANQWSENVNSPPFLHHVEVETGRPAAAELPNLSVAEPQVQRIFLGDKSLANFTVRLSHRGPAASATVVLRDNGRVIFSRAVDLEGQPETLLIQAQWEADPKLWVRGEVSVEGGPDALAGDNRAFFSLPPVREGRVALLAQSPYLRVALSSDVMRGQWETRVVEPSRLTEEFAAGNDAEVLVIESSYLQSSDARKLVWRYLSNGHGVFLAVNKVTPTVSGALRELGFELQPDIVGARAAPVRFDYVFPHHPIFQPFLSPDYGSLADVRVFRHARLKAVNGLPLIFSDAGDLLFFQGTKLPGKLYVAAFGLERGDTSWPLQLTFVPFLDLCLQNARPEDPTTSNYEPAEVASISLPVASAVREVVLRESGREIRRVPLVKGKAQLRMPDQPGLYEVTFDDDMRAEKIFAINPSPKESQLTYVEQPEAIKAWIVSAGSGAESRPATGASTALSLPAILQQRYWWWLLVGGLAALIIETFWSGLRKEPV